MKKILLLILFSFPCLSMELFKGAMYFFVSSDEITVAWDDSEGAEFYELRSLWMDPKTPVEIYLGRTSETQFTITGLRSGHHRLQVRAGNFNGETEVYSNWSSSDNMETGIFDGEHMGWRIYTGVQPVDDVVIE